jgi:uncharacterized glyoxalase superfamily protein PhnB
MSDQSHLNIIPCLQYGDGHAAIDWLCRAFGFEKHAVHSGPDGTVVHAELRLGPAFVMLGSNPSTCQTMNWKSPRGAGCVTQTVYIVVDDPDAHHDRAKAAGAEIVRELNNTDYGSREYGARDPEGHLWHFGTYRPG